MKLSKRKAIKYSAMVWAWMYWYYRRGMPMNMHEKFDRIKGSEKRMQFLKKEFFKSHPGRIVPYNYCYACEYNLQNDNKFCYKNCILADIWKNEHCNISGSPFYTLVNFWDCRRSLDLIKQIALSCRDLYNKEYEEDDKLERYVVSHVFLANW